MSRTNKILKNAKVGTFFFVLVSFIGFYSRSIFLDKLGDDFIGLIATLQSFLSFLNLVELGVGTAMGFAMYNSVRTQYHNDNDIYIYMLSCIITVCIEVFPYWIVPG